MPTVPDYRTVGQLQRNIDDARRTRALARLAITVLILLLITAIALIVLGNVLAISWITNVGGGLLGLYILALVFSPVVLMECRIRSPFQDVRNAERKLKDYYDHVADLP